MIISTVKCLSIMIDKFFISCKSSQCNHEVDARKGQETYTSLIWNILFHFSDRISAFDVKMATPIPKKGEVLCKFAEFWFDKLQTPNHMLKVVAKDKMEVKKLQNDTF